MSPAKFTLLSEDELRAVVKSAVREALAERDEPRTEVTEEDLARARKTLRKLGRGA